MTPLAVGMLGAHAPSSASRRRLRRRVGLAPAALIFGGLFAVSAGPLAVPAAAAVAPRSGSVVGWGSESPCVIKVPAGLAGVSAIAAGGDHCLALKRDGTVVAWGANAAGDIDVPAGLAGVTAIAAGTVFSLALKTDGTVVAWGDDFYYETSVPAGLSGVIAISASGWHSLALKSDGTVVAWGNSDNGSTTVPAGLSGVTAIAAGGDVNDALKSDGTVVAWGSSENGRTAVPAGLSGVTAIAAGGGFSLALKSNKTVVAWGDNSGGQTNIPAGLSGVTAIAAGNRSGLALKSDGTIVAWGDDSSGQTNVPAGLSGVTRFAIGTAACLALKNDGSVVAWGQLDAQAASMTGISAIAAGGKVGGPFSLALKSDGTVVGWGANGQGQTSIPAGLSGVTAISAGGDFSLALKSDGTVVGWGENGSGQTTVPAGLSGVTAISAGPFSSLALKSDGTVVGWGYASRVLAGLSGVSAISESGLGSVVLKSDGTVLAWGYSSPGFAQIALAGFTGVNAIAAGHSQVLGLEPNGTVVAWDYNPSGQTTLVPGLTDVIAIAAGDSHALALRSDGTIVAWGDDSSGQTSGPPGLSGVTSIAAGGVDSLALVAAPHLIVGTVQSCTAGASESVKVRAVNAYGDTAIGYRGRVHFSSSDPEALLPGDYTFTPSDAGTHVFSVVLETVGTQSVTATDTATASITGAQGGIVVNPARSTYHPVTPVRLLDTRSGNGLSGKLVANTPRAFQITGRNGIPAGANAVTGNVTVANSTNAWAVYIGPVPVAKPNTSTLNFNAGDIKGNGLTVALRSSGSLSATYMGPAGATTDLIFDVTGYFTPDTSGDTYHPMNPVRELDTRANNGINGKITANTPAYFQVTGRNGVPASAKAVTGNVTVVGSSAGWAVYLGPAALAHPTTSAVNFSAGAVAGNNLTVALSSTGTLWATFMGPAGAKTDLVFDVTGYYTADATGASFVALSPARVLDTRNGTGPTGKISANTPRTFAVSGVGGVPTGALGVTGNVTVVNETAGWAVFLGPTATVAPKTSTINFVLGDVKGNGLTVALSATGTLSATYISSGGNKTDLVFDVTGYFVR